MLVQLARKLQHFLYITNSSGSTAYVTVEYKLIVVPGLYIQDAEEADNLTITNGETNTSLTASVPDGSSIQWRYKSSDTSGDWSGLSYVTDSDMNSSTVVCSNPVSFSISQALGTCSGGSNTSTLTITNMTKVQQVIFMSSTKSIVALIQ